MYSVSVLGRAVKEYDLNVLLTRSEDHTEAVNSAKLCGLKIGNEADLLTDKLIGSVELCDSRNDLALLVAKVNLKL